MEVIYSDEVVETVLDRYAAALGADLSIYRNHVYRGLNYQARLLGVDEVPRSAALAWAAHDLGIWSAGTWDYLEPSAELAGSIADELGIDPSTAQRMVAIHHSVRPVDDRVAETFRRADRADAWKGRWRGGLSRQDIAEVSEAFPYEGFHAFLARGMAKWVLGHPLDRSQCSNGEGEMR